MRCRTLLSNSLVGYAKKHGLSVTLLFQAVRFARAHPGEEWKRKPVGCGPQISPQALQACYHAWQRKRSNPKLTHTALAAEIGISRATLLDHFRKYDAQASTPK